VIAAIVVELLRMYGRSGGDLALALIFYSGIAGGVVLSGLAGSLNGGILTYLFGSILTVSAGDAWTIVALGVVIFAVIARTWRALFSIVLDEEAARVAGLPVDGLNLLVAGLAAVTVVAAMRVVGILLVAALMVLPVGAAQRLVTSFRTTMAVAAALGALASVVGLGIARVWGLAPGGTIVLVAAATFGIAAAVAALTRRRAKD
jgi:zinc transport system permease protein